ncbi:MAG: phosphogluconate dehydrogenase (NAD(+)-dependent, decarboxylating) [Gemmataceae bacterium]
MQLGMIGLGKMGGNMVLRLLRAGHDCVAYDHDAQRTEDFDKEEKKRSIKAKALADLIQKLTPPRHIWLMLPAGTITENTVNELAGLLQSGDTIIDGGNTYFKDDVRRAEAIKPKGLHYVDVGTSGGVWGITRGYCMMIGGEQEIVQRLDPIFNTLAPGGPGKTTAERGYLHCGPVGSGHFVKMVHNGIEYGLMQAYGEGFEVLQKANSERLPANRRYDIDLHAVAEVWRHGSVISSWLLDLLEIALRDDPKLAKFEGYVQDSGEGRWTLEAAIDEDVPATVLAHALFARFRSRIDHAFADKVLSAMRMGFGGHVEGAESGSPPPTT